MTTFDKIYHANTIPFTALTIVPHIDCADLTPKPNLIGEWMVDEPASWKPNGVETPIEIHEGDVSFFEYYDKPLTSLYQAFKEAPLVHLYELPDTSQLTTIQEMFYNCADLVKVNTRAIDTSNVVNMGSTFAICRRLQNVDVSTWDTSKCRVMAYLFYYCEAFTEIDLSHFDTSQVDNMAGMFTSCPNLTKLDLSSFDLSKVWTMDIMFASCVNLEFLLMNGFGAREDVVVSDMFSRCSKWGSGATNNRASLTGTLVYNSFDRAAAGYSSLAITLPAAVAQRLTLQERNTMTRKGYTITIES